MAVKIGMMSFAHMHALSYALCVNALPNAELVGIADHDLDRARQMAENFNTRAFESYDELLGADIDAVIICSENVRHRELTEMAAAAGKHVMSEKPLATNIADGMAMVEACKKAGVKLQTAFPCRFHPAMQRCKAAIDSGQIGKILAIKGTNHGRCPGGWFVDKQLSGGGAVMDHTVHVADLMRWVTGSEVVEVYAEIENTMFKSDYDDIGLLTLQFADGTFATLDSSWSRPKSFPTWGDVTMDIIGESGFVGMDMFAQNIDVYTDSDMRYSWHNWGANMDMGLVRSFINAIQNDMPVQVSGEDGLEAVRVVQAAYKSDATGEVVKVER
jgi:myo-inositol 2-dehydrogenase/D-chiro-inositol 1-dehydrogenase